MIKDLVIKGGGKYDLMVATCKSKREWENRLLVIEFEGQFYEIVRREQGSPPRSVVYFLKKAPQWKSVAAPYKYDPDAVEEKSSRILPKVLGIIVSFFSAVLPPQLRPWIPESDNQIFMRMAAYSGVLEFMFALLAHGLRPPVSYVLEPVGLLYLYFILEGIVRYVAARHTGQALPILPLYVLGLMVDAVQREQERKKVGPPVVDIVTAGHENEFDLKIASCRRKQGWDNPHLVIAYKDEFYEVVRREEAEPPRKYVYFLRKAPSWKITAHARKYDPRDVLDAP